MDGTCVGAGAKGQHSWWGPPMSWAVDLDASQADTKQACYDAERRHNGAANVLFCDWHVKLVRPDDFKTDSTDSSNNPRFGGARLHYKVAV